jgi:hypothetical protein
MADRIEREIEDILRKIDGFVPENGQKPPSRRPRPKPLAAAQGWLGHRLARISLNQIMMWSLIIMVGAFFLRALPFASWIMLGSVIILATAFVLSLRGGGSTRNAPEKRWRGQPLDLSGPSWPDRVKYWLKGKRRR